MLLHLAESIAGYPVHPHKGPRQFEGGQVSTAARFQRGWIEVAAGHDPGHGDLTFESVRYPRHGGFGHLRLFHEELFEFPRIDVEASADDEIAAPPAQRVVAVGRKDGEIPGAEPAVSKSGPGRLFFLPIARKNIGTLQVDFTGFTRCDCHARVVEQAHGNARQWKADAALAAFADVRVGDVHQRLRHPVAFQNRMPEQRTKTLHHLRRQRRRSGDEEPHASPNRARDLRRGLQEPPIDSRRAEEQCRPEVQKLGGGSLMLEALQQAHAAAAEHPAVQTVAQRVHVEERQRQQEAVGGADLPAGEQVNGVCRSNTTWKTIWCAPTNCANELSLWPQTLSDGARSPACSRVNEGEVRLFRVFRILGAYLLEHWKRCWRAWMQTSLFATSILMTSSSLSEFGPTTTSSTLQMHCSTSASVLRRISNCVIFSGRKLAGW